MKVLYPLKKIQIGGGPIQDFCKSAVWVSAAVKGTYFLFFLGVNLILTDPIHKGVSLFLSYANMNEMNSVHHMKEHPKISNFLKFENHSSTLELQYCRIPKVTGPRYFQI